jgi:hypothetical protein
MVNKKAAIELSVGTMVVIVLGVTMLILGLILITNIFRAGGEATDLISNNLKAQINKQFNKDDTRTIVYLADNKAEIKKGEKSQFRFGINNIVKGESDAGSFTYQVKATEVGSTCSGLTEDKAESYIDIGKSGGPILIFPGADTHEEPIILLPSENAPLCTIKYNIFVEKDNEIYDVNFFTIDIV